MPDSKIEAEKEDPYQESLTSPIARDEVLKLILILEQEPFVSFSRKYLFEKLNRIYQGIPIALHPILQRRFNKEVKEGIDRG